MVFLRIVSKSEAKINEIAKVLLEEKLVIDVNVKRHIDRAELVNGELLFTKVYLLTAKTRAVLFDAIDDLLNKMYPNHLPEIYALPIMQMDWKQAEKLTKDVKKVKKINRWSQVLERVRKK